LHLENRIQKLNHERVLFMTHPKMQHTYVGLDSHKDTHTAVFLDCFFEKLGELTFANLPSTFDVFLSDAQKFLINGTTFMFGFEDISSYGRALTVYLKQNGQHVKHVNALLVARERKNQNIVQKTDSVDAECAARVLLSKFSELPDADTQDNYWILRTLVSRHRFLVKNRTAAKKQLHSFVTQHYPNYRQFFENIDSATALAFFERYPSPGLLRNTTVEELTAFLQLTGRGYYQLEFAQHMLDTLQETAVQHQEYRDAVIQSTIRQVRFVLKELEQLEEAMRVFLKKFDCTLTSMTGIDTLTAARMMAYIGDIRKFSTPAKLARYAGIAPVTYASGKKDAQFANERGNRQLNTLFFGLAVRVSFATGKLHKVTNSFFHDYYNRKISEGKTKRQALKSVQRRLVNIIWTMLTNNEEYVNPPVVEMGHDIAE